jgi:hypothetical protein
MSIKYYQPSKSLKNYLNKELQSLRSTNQTPNAGGQSTTKYKRDKKTRSSIAKNKIDAVDRIFQALADIIYFLEFIENHPELHDIYDRDLKDLFGINTNPDVTHQNHGNAFSRFIAASLFNNLGAQKELDFRVHLIKTLIDHAIKGLRIRIQSTHELRLMDLDSEPFWLWGNLIEARRKERGKISEAKRSIYP